MNDLTNSNSQNFALVCNPDALDYMTDELEGFDSYQLFTTVKAPSGGAIQFEIPTENADEPELAAVITGVIVDHHPVNSYWSGAYDGTVTNPDCSSIDGHTGINLDGEKIDCRTCPLNQFGSGENGSGKACKNAFDIYMLRSGDMFPLQIRVPASSISGLKYYLVNVVKKYGRAANVVSSIGLTRAKSKSGIVYSQMTFACERPLNKEEKEQMTKYSAAIKQFTRAITSSAAEPITDPKASASIDIQNIEDDDEPSKPKAPRTQTAPPSDDELNEVFGQADNNDSPITGEEAEQIARSRAAARNRAAISRQHQEQPDVQPAAQKPQTTHRRPASDTDFNF